MCEHSKIDTILATYTSAIPIAQIAAAIRDPSRVVGAHFWWIKSPRVTLV
ncbi:MAG: hypothetical protein KTR16_02390 [Acidiferrobacterales bacterium]|nr:hypothetical protein [Acidiferrobacterales bacterium]